MKRLKIMVEKETVVVTEKYGVKKAIRKVKKDKACGRKRGNGRGKDRSEGKKETKKWRGERGKKKSEEGRIDDKGRD